MAFKINDNIVQFVNNLAGESETVLEIDNSEDSSQAIEIRLTDKSQTDPAGRFRIRLSGDSLTIQRATAANWALAKTLMTFTGDGASIEFDEQALVDLFELLLSHVGDGSAVGLKFLELVQTATLLNG